MSLPSGIPATPMPTRSSPTSPMPRTLPAISCQGLMAARSSSTTGLVIEGTRRPQQVPQLPDYRLRILLAAHGTRPYRESRNHA